MIDPKTKTIPKVDDSNTVEKQLNKPKRKGQFVKGDPRINRRGRPKSFDQLRKLAQKMSYEIIGEDSEGNPVSAIYSILQGIAKENPEKFLEIAFGKVPNPIEMKVESNSTVGFTPDAVAAAMEFQKKKDGDKKT